MICCLFFLPTTTVAFDSLLGFENHSKGSTGINYIGQVFTNSTMGQCLSNLMKLDDLGQLSNNYLPPTIEDNLTSPPVSSLIANLEIQAAVAVGGTAIVAAINPLFGAGLALVVVAAQALQMIDVCTNVYVVQPHEYYNRDVLGLGCSGSSPNIVFAPTSTKSVVAQNQIPYYFSCDQNYDPTQGQDPNIGQYPNIGVGWGYNQALCTSSILANANSLQSNIGKIKVEVFPGIKRIYYNVQNCDGFWGAINCAKNALTLDNTPFPACGKTFRSAVTLSGGEIKRLDGTAIYVYAYFYLNTNHTQYQYPAASSSDSNSAQLQMCAIAYAGFSATVPSMWPIKIGCTMVAPPRDNSRLDPFFANFTSGTRCQYLISGRNDLLSLGKNLNSTDGSGMDSTAIAKFLQSDLHMFSTGIGCVQDLLTKYILRPANGQTQSFFEIMQQQLRNIVLAALALAVALFGIKIIASAEPLKHGEYITWGVKFALVMAFALGNMWYSTSGNSPALFSAIINTSNIVGGYFLAAAQKDDPIGNCRYDYNGQLLTERLVTSSPAGGSLVYTEGYNGVKIEGYNGVKVSIWDFIDCKLINYLNFGSCQYNWYGLIFGIIASLGFPFGMLFGGGLKILIAISTWIFAFMFILLLVRFALVTIVSLFTLTVLTLLSPIFICFALFEATKGIFKGWFDMILGYMLYPGLLFAFMALMLATFDSVFYGDISDINSTNDIVAYCKDKSGSVYCSTVVSLANNSCIASKNAVNIMAAFTDTITIPVLGWQFKTLKTSVAENYWEALKRLVLFATLFWLLHSSIFRSMAVMLNVPDIAPGPAFEKNYLSQLMAPSQAAAGLAAKGAAVVGLRTAGIASRMRI